MSERTPNQTNTEEELDELWSFVGKKANRWWIWLALDATTRQILAFHVGDRSARIHIVLKEDLKCDFAGSAAAGHVGGNDECRMTE